MNDGLMGLALRWCGGRRAGWGTWIRAWSSRGWGQACRPPLTPRDTAGRYGTGRYSIASYAPRSWKPDPLLLGLCNGMLQVVVGSWYGDKAVPLHLGLGFHRSHMRLIVSQVGSRIHTHPCNLPSTTHDGR